MSKLIIFVGLVLTWNGSVRAVNLTDSNNQNKAKRGVLDQTHYYGEPTLTKTFHTPTFPDSVSAATSGANSANNYYNNNPRPILFNNLPVQLKVDNEPPKQVTVQQVLYEYQQTPHNAVSNVHVNQHFQTSPEQRQYVPDAEHSQANPHIVPPANVNPQFVNQHHILHVEPNQFNGVATPVQHGAVIHHGQGYPKLLYGPFNPVPSTTAPLPQANGQTKYIYANGKILYHPAPLHLHNANTPYPGVVLPARPHNLVANPNLLLRAPPIQQQQQQQQRAFKPSPLVPITYGKIQAHPRPPSKPVEAPVKEDTEEDKDSDERSEVRDEQEEEDDDRANYEEEEDEEESTYHPKYRYESDEDEDHDSYREQEEEEDDDNTRSYTRYIRRKPKKIVRSESKPRHRYQKNDHFKIKEGYKANKKYSSDFKSPNYFKFDAKNKKPKGEYKSYKYYKAASNIRPKKEPFLEGRQSQHVPVIHKEKLFQTEKWLVTKKEGSE